MVSGLIHHCVDSDEVDYYRGCRCDPSRRRQTSLDGWTLHCGKCIMCGRYGHCRRVAGFPALKGEYCDYHYEKVNRARPNEIRTARRRSKGSPQQAIKLLCGDDMGCDMFWARKRDEFIRRRWHTPEYRGILEEYMRTGDNEDRIALVRELPWTFPVDEKRKLLQEIMSAYRER